MQTITEVAKLLKVSRQTIYNKIDKMDLHRFTKVENNIKLISEEGIEALKKTLNIVNDSVNFESKTVNESKYIDTLIESLKSENMSLKGIISEQSKQIDNLTRLLENMQVLQREQKLIEESKNKGSFWERLFKS